MDPGQIFYTCNTFRHEVLKYKIDSSTGTLEKSPTLLPVKSKIFSIMNCFAHSKKRVVGKFQAVNENKVIENESVIGWNNVTYVTLVCVNVNAYTPSTCTNRDIDYMYINLQTGRLTSVSAVTTFFSAIHLRKLPVTAKQRAKGSS